MVVAWYGVMWCGVVWYSVVWYGGLLAAVAELVFGQEHPLLLCRESVAVLKDLRVISEMSSFL